MSMVTTPYIGYVKFDLTGKWRTAEVMALLDTMRANADALECNRVLVDVRHADGTAPVGDRVDMGVKVAEDFGARYRIAVLDNPEHVTNLFKYTAVSRGAVVNILTAEPAAVAWLMEQ
ncbi:MAG TPA: hypothetical protein VGK19_11585 [Capsulimonadaceae bacterium]